MLTVAGLLSAVVAFSAPVALAQGTTTVEYQGTLNATIPECSAGPSPITPYDPATVSVTWDATATTNFTQTVVWNFKTLTGKVSLEITAPSGSGCGPGDQPGLNSCSAVLSEKPGWETSGYDNVSVGEDTSDNVNLSTSLTQAAGAVYGPLVSNDTAGDFCDTQAQSGGDTDPVNPAYDVIQDFQAEQLGTAAQQAELANALNPQVTDPPGGPYTTPFNFSWSGDPDSLPQSVSITSSLIVNPDGSTGPGSSSHPCQTWDPFNSAFADCIPVKPAEPDKEALSRQREAERETMQEQEDAEWEEEDHEKQVEEEAESEGRTRDLSPAEISQLIQEARDLQAAQEAVFTGITDNEIIQTAAHDVDEDDPPSTNIDQIALPAPPPSSAIRVSCRPGNGHVACAPLLEAANSYRAKAGRVAEVWEALAAAANRWGTAYGEFSSDSPDGPEGLYLQTALMKAYYGELGAALSKENAAAGSLRAALRDAGVDRLRVSVKERDSAQRALERSGPPTSAVRYLVSNGLAGSAEVRSDWHALMNGIKVPRTIDFGAALAVAGPVPQIPGETYRSMTLDDLQWIALAVPSADGRSVLTRDLVAANGATGSARHTDLEQFLTYVQHHEHGELSTLLQTAVAPLLS